MNSGYQVDCDALHAAAQALRQSVADLNGILKAIDGSQCDIPGIPITEWTPQGCPSAVGAYADVREQAETFLTEMIARLGHLADGLDTVAQDYRRAEAANTAAVGSTSTPVPNAGGPASQEKIPATTTVPGAGRGATGAALQPPPRIEEIIQRAKALGRSIDQGPLALVLKPAWYEVPKIFAYLDELVTKAERYLTEWVTAPTTVNHVADQWEKQAGNLRHVLADCQLQVNEVQNYWSGTAADNFTEYAKDGLFSYFPGAVQGFAGVSSGLRQLADKMGYLDNSIILGGAGDVVSLLMKAGVEVEDAVVGDVPADAIPVYGEVKTASDVAEKLIDLLAEAVKDLGGVAEKVANYLDDIGENSGQMQGQISTNVPLPLPPEPPGLSAPGSWHPK